VSKYLTAGQYRRYSDGISLTDVTDLTLNMIISRSENAIDAHMGFDVKRGGFEPHEVMIQQQFNERTRKTFHPHSNIPVRQVTRYRIQVSNLESTGAGFFANINPNDAVINNDQDYIEIVPLSSITYALSPVLMQLGLSPCIVEMDCAVGYYIPTLGISLINDGKFKTYYAPFGFWATSYSVANALTPNTPPPVPPVVYVNGVVQSSSTYTFDATDGSVTFNSMQSPTSVVTADITKQIPDYVTEAAVLQTSYLLSQRSLNKMGVYKQLYHVRTGEQQISFPRVSSISDQGRSTPTSLCPDAAAILSRFDEWGIA
jgi:hypothetical protein